MLVFIDLARSTFELQISTNAQQNHVIVVLVTIKSHTVYTVVEFYVLLLCPVKQMATAIDHMLSLGAVWASDN